MNLVILLVIVLAAVNAEMFVAENSAVTLNVDNVTEINFRHMNTALNRQPKITCAAGAAINKLIIVRSRKRIKSSGKLTGIFEPRIKPPTSDK